MASHWNGIGKPLSGLVEDLRYGPQRLRIYRTQCTGSEVADLGPPQAAQQLQLGFDLLGELAVLLEQILRIDIERGSDRTKRLSRDNLFLAVLQQRPPGPGDVVGGLFLGRVPDGGVVVRLAAFGAEDGQKEIDLSRKGFRPSHRF